MDDMLYAFGISTLSMFAGVIAHEFGHYFMARAVGFDVARFRIGVGPLVYFRSRGGMAWQWHAVPLGGFVGFVFPESRRHGALGAIVAAGPLTNLLLFFAAAGGVIALIAVHRYVSLELMLFGVIQLVVFLMTLLPFKGKIGGLTVPTDGLRLWHLMIGSSKFARNLPEAYEQSMRDLTGETVAYSAAGADAAATAQIASRWQLSLGAPDHDRLAQAYEAAADRKALTPNDRLAAYYALAMARLLVREPLAHGAGRLVEKMRAIDAAARPTQFAHAFASLGLGELARAESALAALRAQPNLSEAHEAMLLVIECEIRMAQGDLSAASALSRRARKQIRRGGLQDVAVYHAALRADLRAAEKAAQA